MKTLVIHPKDSSTDFLCPIYKDFKNKEVIRGGISKKDLLPIVHEHERIIMLGHGGSVMVSAKEKYWDKFKNI